MEAFLSITNLLLLLFWVRLWSRPEHDLYFNPFLSAPTRLTDRVLDFLRPVLPLPQRVTALLVLVFLLTLRAAALNYFRPEVPWSITLGTLFRFAPRDAGLPGMLLFSTLQFLFFVVRFWGVYVFVQLLTPVPRRDRASEAFHFAALPLSMLRRWAHPLVLVAAHALLVYELNAVSVLDAANPLSAELKTFVPPAAGAAGHVPFLACLTLFSLADPLLLAMHLMFACLIGSFIAALLQSPMLQAVCAEGVNVLLGNAGRRLVVGFIDLTPLLFMAAVYLAHNILVFSLLLSLILKLG
jgi:hypothetical protein